MSIKIKVFTGFIFFMLLSVPARANNWCQKPYGGVEPCPKNIVPTDWVRCGTFNGEFIWCHPSASDDDKTSDNAKKTRPFYAGFSLGKTIQINGGMKANYTDQHWAWIAPGSFKKSEFQDDGATAIQFSIGAEITDYLRVDVSHLRYFNIFMPRTVMTAEHWWADGYIPVRLIGGDVSSNANMVNVYYNLDHIIQYLQNAKLRPYIGAGIGIGKNTISDYVVHDGNFYRMPGVEGTTPSPGTVTAITDIFARHLGKSTKNTVYMFEGGATYSLDERLLLDFFVRWANLGRVETSGIFLSQTEYIATGTEQIPLPGSEKPADGTGRQHLPDWRESGTLNIVDIGLRLRLLF
ncbi:MAG: hypothetical protein FWE50_01120 [Alphaproteobacteria bacterium]|nr:hypothetical protein [Alphaproteobacteria bacterium]